MKNNKGFSLVEILASMVILAIVSTVGIVSINSMINKSRQHFYDSQEKQMVLAAQSYVNDNRNVLPRNVGGIQKIKLSTLREKNYLKEDIIDQDKNVCDKDASYVTIYKSSRSEYKYSGYLECPACRKGESNTCYTSNNKIKPVINIIMTKLNGNQGDRLFEDGSNITINLDSVADTSDHPDIRIASYSYKIYVNNELKYDSGTKIDNKRQSFKITEELYKYVPGKVKVVATVTNTDGSTTSKTVTEDYGDLQNPSCGMVTYEGAYPLQLFDSQTNNTPECGSAGNAWINSGSRNVWVVCHDTKDIGCAQHEFSQVFTSEGVTDNIMIKDKSGKTFPCKVNKCIDLTTTEVTINVYKRKSNGQKDGGVQQTVTVSKVKSANTSDNKEYSGWVNAINYPHGVIIEVVLKDSLSNVKSLTWKENKAGQRANETLNANQNVTPTSSDTLGTSKNYTATHAITTEGVRKEVITVEDTPGNKMTVNYTIKIDFTPPTCDITKTNLYTTSGVTVTTTCSDNPNISGVNYCESQHTGIKDDVKYNVTDVAGNKNECSKAVYKQRQSRYKTRTWNTCLTGSPNACQGGYVTYACQGLKCRGNGSETCIPSSQVGSVIGAGCHSCNECTKWDDCATTKNTCKAGWNSWGGYSDWSNVSSCDEGEYNHTTHGNDHYRDCQTLYY